MTCLVRLLLLGRCGDMLLAVEVLSTYLWSWAVLMPDADEVGANTDEAEDDVMAWLEWRSIDWEDDDTATMWLSGGWRSNFWGPPAATEAAPPTECSWVGIIDGRSFSGRERVIYDIIEYFAIQLITKHLTSSLKQLQLDFLFYFQQLHELMNCVSGNIFRIPKIAKRFVHSEEFDTIHNVVIIRIIELNYDPKTILN